MLISLERDLFPVIGSTPVTEIDKPRMLAAITAVEQRGAIESAHRLRQRASRIFAFAAANGAENANPAHGIIDALSAMPAKKRWPAIVEIDRLHTFVQDVDASGSSPVTRLASRFTALTAQRPAMIRRMPWSEIEGVEWSAPASASPDALWRVPPQRMKLEHDATGDEAFEHVIPLAPEAVETLRAIRRLTGAGPLVFPSIRNSEDPISENAIGYLYNRIGYKGVHVPHGWRSSFSTIMNQRTEREHVGSDRLNIDRVIIDLMLAHVPLGMSATEWRYNRARYMERRRELACDWASILLAGAMPAMSLMEGRRRPTDK